MIDLDLSHITYCTQRVDRLLWHTVV